MEYFIAVLGEQAFHVRVFFSSFFFFLTTLTELNSLVCGLKKKNPFLLMLQPVNLQECISTAPPQA